MLCVAFGRLEYALDHGVPIRSPLSLAALRHLPRDYPGSQGALSSVVGRRNAGIVQEPQEVPPLVVFEQAFAEPLVDLAPQWRAVEQPVDAGVDGVPCALILLKGKFVAGELLMQGMRVLEGLQQAGGVHEAPPGSAFVQHHRFFHVADDVMEALLMRPPGEGRVIVYVVPVRDERASERLSQQLIQIPVK